MKLLIIIADLITIKKIVNQIMIFFINYILDTKKLN